MPLEYTERMEQELRSRGLPDCDAAAFSNEWIRRYPLAQRVGVVGTARLLERKGLPAPRSTEAAAVLFALEGYQLGHLYQRVLGDLTEGGLSAADATAAALEAARLRRESLAAPKPEARLTPALLWAFGPFLMIAAAAVAGWVVRAL